MVGLFFIINATAIRWYFLIMFLCARKFSRVLILELYSNKITKFRHCVLPFVD